MKGRDWRSVFGIRRTARIEGEKLRRWEKAEGEKGRKRGKDKWERIKVEGGEGKWEFGRRKREIKEVGKSACLALAQFRPGISLPVRQLCRITLC